MKFKHISELVRETENVVLLCTGSSLNDINKETWEWLLKYDTLAVNNFVYHPWIIPKWNFLEVKTYDFPFQQKYLKDKWEMGWKNVGYISPSHRVDYIASCINHPTAQIYTYDHIKRKDHPKNSPNFTADADFNPDGVINKSYDASVTSIIQILYQMNYKNIIIIGMDMINSRYFWTDMDIPVHDKWNKAREGKTQDKPHNASHVLNYMIDFNNRHMKPNGREMFVMTEKTALYSAIRIWGR